MSPIFLAIIDVDEEAAFLFPSSGERGKKGTGALLMKFPDDALLKSIQVPFFTEWGGEELLEFG